MTGEPFSFEKYIRRSVAKLNLEHASFPSCF